ncbi:MAG: pseudouridine synthase [Nanoarchaeota archaeon]|nr:rRNA pseudouridine synthase [Nanoarchaeota archaeon]MBU1631718.1 rRNA pseudouridine synthase [Nanoarchaeota archaeon]MBU1876220.1 rRNA pseudouridine synthase [Nanoarchaeota archaeon]
MQRVQKLLSNYGYCSRRKAEELIEKGRVKVNDKVISLGDKASEDDNIYVDNRSVRKERKVYIKFNKPLGCVTALRDKQYKTVMDYIRVKERIFPIGRLDYNSTGLLLLTNDGDFANKIMHPSHEIKKTYLVEINRPINDNEIKQIEKGIVLKDGKTAPAKIRKQTNNLLEITIHEGKNRIIRRIFDALDFKVSYLQRIRIGKLSLGTLEVKGYKYLTNKEREKIFQ